MSGRRGLFTIGVVARLTGMHEQTIRQYERLGLIHPERSPGGTRMFSEEELERLQAINALTRDMGVNLAGVELILRMREQNDKLLALAREMFRSLDEGSRSRFEQQMRGDEPGLVPVPKQGLATLAQEAARRRRIAIEDGEE